MTVRSKVRHRPVRVASVVLAVLMWVLTVIPGDEPPIVIQLVTLLAPIIAGLITERFTFSQAFLKEVLGWLELQHPNGNPVSRQSVVRNMELRDDRIGRMIGTGTDNPSPRDRGATAVEVVLIIVGVIFVLWLLGLLTGR